VSYLIGTNVLSELRRKTPDPAVVHWFSQRRLVLLDWLETELPAFFSGRILGINTAVADRWGRLLFTAGH
jgi:toxin FitB